MAENIIHFGAVTMRVNGSGLMKMRWISLDDAVSQELIPFTMATSPGKEPSRLSNFVQQRARLKMYTTELDEYFQINRVVLFVKEIYSQYPGTE